MQEAAIQVRERLREVLRLLDQAQAELEQTVRMLIPPEELDRTEDAEDAPAVELNELRALMECLVEDRLRPAIAALHEATGEGLPDETRGGAVPLLRGTRQQPLPN